MIYETISVIGLGYIGLPTAHVCLKRKQVKGVDVTNVETINVGISTLLSLN